MNSRAKGKRGELEFKDFAKECGFEEARRGQQFSGLGDSPDVVGIPGLHVEVKRTETYSHRSFTGQAVRDAAGKPWAVFHKFNRGRWTATVDAEWLLRMYRSEHAASRDQAPQGVLVETERQGLEAAGEG
jgi:hypothetical protein